MEEETKRALKTQENVFFQANFGSSYTYFSPWRGTQKLRREGDAAELFFIKVDEAISLTSSMKTETKKNHEG